MKIIREALKPLQLRPDAQKHDSDLIIKPFFLGTSCLPAHIDSNHHSPDQMEDEALQCAEVCPAELVDHRIHSVDHLPLVWLT